MKLFKYKKIIAFSCALILLVVFLTFPVSAAASFSPSDNLNVYTTPGHFIINYYVTPAYGSSYYASYSCSPLVSIYPDTPIVYTWLMDDYTAAWGDEPYLKLRIDSAPILNSHTDLTIDENNNLNGLASFDFMVRCASFETDYAADPFISSFQFVDFYCWNYEDVQEFTSEIVLYIRDFDREISSIDIVYRSAGTLEYISTTLDVSDFHDFRVGNFEISPEDIDGNARSDALYYVKSLTINLSDPVPGDTDTTEFIDFDSILSFCYYPSLLEIDIAEHADDSDGNPALALAPYTTWLANAVSGFMDFELYKGFSLGGIFMTIIAFACCVWFIKLVAGG